MSRWDLRQLPTGREGLVCSENGRDLGDWHSGHREQPREMEMNRNGPPKARLGIRVGPLPHSTGSPGEVQGGKGSRPLPIAPLQPQVEVASEAAGPRGGRRATEASEGHDVGLAR